MAESGNEVFERSRIGVVILIAATAAGIAAGATAAITASLFPHAVRFALSSLSSYSTKKEEAHSSKGAEKATKSSSREKARKSGSKEKQKEKEKEKGKIKEKDAAKEGGMKEAILKGLISWHDIDLSFENFPYFLSETTKSSLLDSVFVRLKCPDFLKFTSSVGALGSRILLSGPLGSETYQEKLLKALARHLKANLLIVDPSEVTSDPHTRLELSAGEKKSSSSSTTTPSENNKVSHEALSLPMTPSGASSQQQLDDIIKGTMCPEQRPPAGPSDSLADKGSVANVAADFGPFSLFSPSAFNVPDSTSDSFPHSTSSSPSLPIMPLTPLACSDAETGLSGKAVTALRDDAESTESSCRGRGENGRNRSKGEAGKEMKVDSKRIPELIGSTLKPLKSALKKGDRVRFLGPPLPPGADSLSSPYAAPLYKSSYGPPVGAKGKVVLISEDYPASVGVLFDKPFLGGQCLLNLCDSSQGFFCDLTELQQEGGPSVDVDKLFIETLLQVVTAEAVKEPLIVFFKNAEKAVAAACDRYMKLEKFGRTGPRAVFIASYTDSSTTKKDKLRSKSHSAKYTTSMSYLLNMDYLDPAGMRKEDGKESGAAPGFLKKAFPTLVTIRAPEDELAQEEWNKRLELDAEMVKAAVNRQKIQSVLATAQVECSDLSNVSITSHLISEDVAEKMVGWGVSKQLQTDDIPPILPNGHLPLNPTCLEESVRRVQEAMKPTSSISSIRTSLKDVVCENDFEKALLGEVIPPNEIGVRFDDIGALEGVKEALQEVIMLPLQRPELFSKGKLTKPVKGLLLFGPPGTGKTMLAKALATESGANFISLSMAAIASKWFGEAEKYVKAMFSLASKIAPCVIFIDEVDSMLGKRGKDTEHSAMRKVKNEFMSNWDGLRTKDAERILIMGATNRPFDLDDAVIRRFPRRIMLDLPDAGNRAKILRVILAEEDLEERFSIEEIANTTNDYSGSDLKNLCVTAAFQRVREVLDREKMAKKKASGAGAEGLIEAKTSTLRPISMADMRSAMEKVRPSLSSETPLMIELAQWNEQYGEGGTKKSTTLSYFM